MSVPLRLAKLFLLALFFCRPLLATAQLPSPKSLQGKAYLSPDGWDLFFLDGKKAIFNLDTVTYTLSKDTLHFVATREWIGEQRHTLVENYVYRISLIPDGIQLQPLRLPYSDSSKWETIQLKDLATLNSDLSGLKSFTITKQLYLTSGGETDQTGPIRSDTVYTVTIASLRSNRRFTTEIRHLRVSHGPEGSSASYEPISKKATRLSKAAYKMKLEHIAKAHIFFMRDKPCPTNYIRYEFRYTDKEKSQFYTRCWLNRLETGLALWVDVAR